MVVFVEAVTFERNAHGAEDFADFPLARRGASVDGGAAFSLAGALRERVFAERLDPLEVVFAGGAGIFVGRHIVSKCRGLTGLLLK